MFVRSFALFLALVVVTEIVYALQVSVIANQKDYLINFNENRFSVIELAEKFCRENAADLQLSTLNDLAFKCMVPTFDVIRQQLTASMDPSSIPTGIASPDVQALFDARREAAAAAAAPAPAKKTAQELVLPKDYKVLLNSNGVDHTLVFDLNNFSVTGVAEKFCLGKSTELGVVTYIDLVDSCIPQVSAVVASKIRSDLVESGVAVADIRLPEGQVSSEVKSMYDAEKRDAAIRAAQVAAASAAVPAAAPAVAPTISIPITVNQKEYVITADRDSFALLNTAEAFCDSRFQELGLTTLDQLVGCVDRVATFINQELSKKYSGISRGSISPAFTEQLARQAAAQQAAAQQAAAQQAAAQQAAAQQAAAQQAAAKYDFQTVYKETITIGNVPYSYEFDITTSSPMNVAEMICSAPALKLSLNFIVSQCLPEVSKIVKATVDRAIAPRSIAIGDYSPSMKDALTRMAKAQP